MRIHITDYRELYKTARVFSLCFNQKMEKHRKDRIYQEYSQSLGRMFLPALIIAWDYR